jgi:hypothetical protein
MVIQEYISKHFGLSPEQTISLENILMNGTRKSDRRKMQKIIKENFLTLVSEGFLKNFHIGDMGLVFVAKEEHKRNVELKVVRQSIFERFEC